MIHFKQFKRLGGLGGTNIRREVMMKMMIMTAMRRRMRMVMMMMIIFIISPYPGEKNLIDIKNLASWQQKSKYTQHITI